MRFLITFLVSSFFASLSAHAQTTTVTSLCQDGVEGSYVGTLKSDAGKILKTRLHVVCVETDRMLASVNVLSQAAPSPGVDAVVTLGFAAVDGNSLVLSAFSVKASDRHEIPARTKGSYLKIPIASLKAGKPTGYYTSGFVARSLKFAAEKKQTYPKLASGLPSPLDPERLVGSYRVQKTESGPMEFFFDVLDGVPRIAASTYGDQVIRLLDGAEWDGSGLLSIATPTTDFEDEAHNLYYIRGRVLDEKTIEIYWLSPYLGLIGPLKAQRI